MTTVGLAATPWRMLTRQLSRDPTLKPSRQVVGVAVVVAVVVMTVGVAVAVVVVVVQVVQSTCAANLPVDRQELVPASMFLLVLEGMTAEELVGGMMTVVVRHCRYPPSRLLRRVQVTVRTWEVQMTTMTTSPSHPW